MDTNRSKLIKLAYRRPDLRDRILPALARMAAAKKKDTKEPAKVTKDIRHPYYEAGDAISALNLAVSSDPVTKVDQKLLRALDELKEAHDKVHEALKPYAWD
jgi:hypothetical protein